MGSPSFASAGKMGNRRSFGVPELTVIVSISRAVAPEVAPISHPPVTFSQPVLVHDLLECLQHDHVALVKLLDGLHERRDVLNLIVTSQSVADQRDVALALRVISLVPVVLDRQLNRLLNILVAHVARPARWKASSTYRSVVLSGSNPQMLSFTHNC
jgi:hypothetical protein